MAGLFGGISSVLLAWAGFGLIFIGLGLFIRHLFGLKIRDAEDVFAAFWTGWAFAIAFLQLWNLQFKIDWRPLVILTIGSAAGLFRKWGDLKQTIKERAPQNGALCLVVLLMAVFLATRALLPPDLFDSGNYHFTSLRWVASYPIVPGLGNLHYRIAFNSSYFLYAAMLDIGPWAHKSHHLANGLLLFILLTELLWSSFKVRDAAEQPKANALFDLLLILPVLRQALTAFISSPSPDLAIFVLSVVISRHLLMLFTNATWSRRETGYVLAYITVLSALGIAVKLSFLALGSTTSVLALATWFAGRKVLDLEDRKTLGWMATGVGLVLVPWMIRGIILSGYVAFPIPLGSFPVDWRMARSDVIYIANDTRAFARQPGEIDPQLVTNWNWLVPWLHRLSTRYVDFLVPVLLTVVGGLTGFYHLRRKPKVRQVPWPFLLPTIASILWWFMAAPDLRFAGSLFWILAAGTITLAVQESGSSARLQLNRLANLRLLAIAAAGLFALSALEGKTEALSVVLKDKDPVRAFRTLHLNSSANLAPAPQGNWTTFVTHSGLTIYVPQDGTTQCWDAPLPCARRALPKLRLRREGDMSRGFILDGTQLY